MTDANFQMHLRESKLPIIAVFFAEWSGSCHLLAPVLRSLSVEYRNRLIVGRLDVDTNRKITESCHIHTLPTLLFFQNGQEQNRIIGLSPRHVIENKLQRILNMTEIEPSGGESCNAH